MGVVQKLIGYALIAGSGCYVGHCYTESKIEKDPYQCRQYLIEKINALQDDLAKENKLANENNNKTIKIKLYNAIDDIIDTVDVVLD